MNLRGSYGKVNLRVMKKSVNFLFRFIISRGDVDAHPNVKVNSVLWVSILWGLNATSLNF